MGHFGFTVTRPSLCHTPFWEGLGLFTASSYLTLIGIEKAKEERGFNSAFGVALGALGLVGMYFSADYAWNNRHVVEPCYVSSTYFI